jgi:prephenate dehydrogenase
MRAVIIGGNGQMGRWFRGICERHFIDYEVVDCDTSTKVDDALQRCDLVVVSVPISVTPEVIKELASFLTPNHLLVDLTSVKQNLQELWSSLTCEVMSLHPMFGPLVEGNSGQNLIVIPVHEGEKALELRKILTQENFCISELTPEEHDKRAALTQVATSVSALLFAAAIGASSSGSQELAPLATPNFEMFWAATARIISSDQRLYSELAGYNVYSLPVIEKFQEILGQIHSYLSSHDLQGLNHLYSEIAKSIPEHDRESGKKKSKDLARFLVDKD